MKAVTFPSRNELTRLIAEADEAAERLDGRIERTPLEPSPTLSALTGARVHLKQENRQATGSCKARSALTILTRERERGARRVITASTGNNGIAMSWAMGMLGMSGQVFVPHTVEPFKAEVIARQGAELVYAGDDIVDAEIAGRAQARASGVPFVSPYNDWGALVGQATIAAEVVEQLGGPPDSLLVPVGGGGLISGVAGYLRGVGASSRVFGVQPERSAVMAASVKAGRILHFESQPTLSDATAGGVEAESLTFDYCRTLVEDYLLVDEDALLRALRWTHSELGITLEGSGALAVAALFQQPERFADRTVVLILCGANIDPKRFAHLVHGDEG